MEALFIKETHSLTMFPFLLSDIAYINYIKYYILSFSALCLHMSENYYYIYSIFYLVDLTTTPYIAPCFMLILE